MVIDADLLRIFWKIDVCLWLGKNKYDKEQWYDLKPSSHELPSLVTVPDNSILSATMTNQIRLALESVCLKQCFPDMTYQPMLLQFPIQVPVQQASHQPSIQMRWDKSFDWSKEMAAFGVL